MCSRKLQHSGSNVLPLWKIKHNNNKNQLPTTVNTFSFITHLDLLFKKYLKKY